MGQNSLEGIKTDQSGGNKPLLENHPTQTTKAPKAGDSSYGLAILKNEFNTVHL